MFLKVKQISLQGKTYFSFKSGILRLCHVIVKSVNNTTLIIKYNNNKYSVVQYIAGVSNYFTVEMQIVIASTRT